MIPRCCSFPVKNLNRCKFVQTNDFTVLVKQPSFLLFFSKLELHHKIACKLKGKMNIEISNAINEIAQPEKYFDTL